jgi:hypothetical protein
MGIRMRRSRRSGRAPLPSRRADRSACHWAVDARYTRPPLRVAALRRNSREMVEADENTNGLLRQCFPKGTELSVHTADQIAALAAALSARPRKSPQLENPGGGAW